MPREQTKIKALRRLTNQIYSILFNQDILDAIINKRKRLKIDIGELKDKTNDSLDYS
ncbi:hypothetical protein ACFLVM_01850 [Chloroflexota bacterium]